MKQLIIFLFFCRFLFAQDTDIIYVAVDDSDMSQWVKAEITRDWTSGKFVQPMLYWLDNKRIELSHKLVVLDRKHRDYPFLDSYPAYRTGKYKNFGPFPKEMWNNETWPLLTVYAIQHNIGHDYKEWRSDCYYIRNKVRSDYTQAVGQWMIMNSPEEFNKDNEYGGDIIELHIGSWRTKYGSLATFPMYTPPKFEPNPCVAMPWEERLPATFEELEGSSK